MRRMGRFLGLLLALACLFASAKVSAATTNFVSSIQAYACATHQWANSLAQANGATTCTQPAVGDLATVAAGTVLANATGSVAAPTATSVPILGLPGTTQGTLGFASVTSGTFTLESATGAVTSYTLAMPAAAPGVNGQALTATTAGVGSWTTIQAAALTVSTNPASPVTLASANDGTRYQITNSTAVTFNLTASLVAGDNWCFAMQASTGAATVAVNSIGTGAITMGNVTGTAGTGTLVGQSVGSSACIYVTVGGANPAVLVWASNGAWNLT